MFYWCKYLFVHYKTTLKESSRADLLYSGHWIVNLAKTYEQIFTFAGFYSPTGLLTVRQRTSANDPFYKQTAPNFLWDLSQPEAAKQLLG